MGWGNPVVAGTVLQVAAIQSPNYVPGSVGWTVKQDGSVEFNNGTFRGTVSAATIIGALIESATSGRRTTLDANGDIKVYNAFGAVLFWFDNAKDAQFYYSDTSSSTQGILSQSFSTLAGNDPFGNAYLPGGVSYSQLSGGIMFASQSYAGEVHFYRASSPTGPWVADGYMTASLTPLGVIQIDAPQGIWITENGGNSPVRINNGIVQVTDPNSPGNAESWHTLTPPSGFSGLVRYKLSAENEVLVQVNISGTLSTGGTLVIGSLTGKYIPANECRFPWGNSVSTATQTEASIASGSGTISAFGLPTTATRVTFMQSVPLD